MSIIPGAAYLSPSEQKVYLGSPGEDVASGFSLRDEDGTEYDYSEDPLPADLFLLYVPGDRVVTEDGAEGIDDFAERVTISRGFDV